jgi:TonB family protein
MKAIHWLKNIFRTHFKTKKRTPLQLFPEMKNIHGLDTMPEFPGGNQAMYQYLLENVKYPVQAREAGIEGMVKVRFTIIATGEIGSVYADNLIGGGCEEAAVRVVASMPQWKPATKNGINVMLHFSITLNFILD